MSQLFDYLFDIEAAPDDDRTADGLCAMFLNVRATGTCGVTTPGEIPCDGPVPGEEDENGYVPGDGGCSGIVFPGLEAEGQATVGTAADMALPVIQCQALGPWWFPGAGEVLLPTTGLAGTARILVLSASALPPLFALARAAALAGAILPGPQGAALAGALANATLPPGWSLLASSGLDRRGDVLVRLPVPIPEGHSCGLVNPVVRRTPQAAVVGLLNRDSAMLAALAAALTPGLDDPDDMAAALLYAVSNLLDYVSDPESLDFGDRWTCSLGAWFRGQGDCEDGAILLHGLLLARGVVSFRLVTIFGRMAPDGMGHAWTCYKRACDERWTVLDWTAGPRSPLAGPDDLPRLDQSPGYHLVEYVLTGEGFHPARMPVADFFAAVRADSLTLPLPECAAAANRAAKGSLRLGSATLFGGPLTCGALAGNAGSMILPALAAAVAAGWRSGRAGLPPLAALARAGAFCAVRLGLPGLAARCGVRAHARCALAPWRSRATGLTAALCLGACRLAGWRLKGGGCGGTLGRGRILPPLVIVRVLGDPGLLGCCALVLPGGRGAGRGFADLTARGGAAVAGLAVFACGVADIAGGETQTLEYRKEAW